MPDNFDFDRRRRDNNCPPCRCERDRDRRDDRREDRRDERREERREDRREDRRDERRDRQDRNNYWPWR